MRICEEVEAGALLVARLCTYRGRAVGRSDLSLYGICWVADREEPGHTGKQDFCRLHANELIAAPKVSFAHRQVFAESRALEGFHRREPRCERVRRRLLHRA